MKTDTRWLGVALAAALAASGCAPTTARIVDSDTDTDTGVIDDPCGDVPDFTAGSPVNTLPARVRVCGPAPAPGEVCAPAETLETWSFLRDALGPTDEPGLCDWYGQDVCGPGPVDGACCYVMDLQILCEGRPLVVGDDVRTAPTALRDDWSADEPAPIDLSGPDRALAAAGWTQTALAEHASVAAFARVTLMLLHHGAPPDLLADTVAAQADEIAHARLAFQIASALGDASVGPGPLPVHGALGAMDLAELLVGTLVEGCLNESFAAAEAGEAALHCTTPAIAQVLHRIAGDEARHAALAWRTAAWILQQDPSLRALAAHTLHQALFAPLPGLTDPAGLQAAGRLDGATRIAVRRATREQVLVPLTTTLLGRALSEPSRCQAVSA